MQGELIRDLVPRLRLRADFDRPIEGCNRPLVLRWTAVPYASKYIVSIATDPGLSNVVLGTRTKPVYTQGINFALPTSLATRKAKSG